MRQTCPNCGFKEHELAIFCTVCATRLSDSVDGTPSSTFLHSLKSLASPSTFFRVIASIALVFAYFPQAYSYYSFLRVGVFLVASYLVYVSIKTEKPQWVVGFAFIAIVFNPIFPIKEIVRETWQFVNILSALFLLLSIFFVGEKLNPSGWSLGTLFSTRLSKVLLLLFGLSAVVIGTVYYSEVAYRKEREKEQRQANANRILTNAMKSAANAMNAAALAMNAAAKTQEEAANHVARSANSSIQTFSSNSNPFDGDNGQSIDHELPCFGVVVNPTGNVSLRASPQMSRSNKICELQNGTALNLNAYSNNREWVNVSTLEGETGWISSRRVRCE